MKNSKTILLLFVAFALTFASCKKCIVCKDRCYKCPNSTDVLCNSDFATDQQFDTVIKYIGNCNQVTSPNQVEICDKTNNVKTIQATYESKRYTCTNK